jgi:predicted MPP superfamily phosphohydrolase
VFVDRNRNGHFDAGEPGVGRVMVSNQLDVVRTAADGTFDLPSRGPFGVVFLTAPTGYRVAGAFYRAAEQPLEFAVAPYTEPATLTFVHASDTHIADAVLPRMKRFEQLVDSVKPNFVLITGDLVRDALRVSETEARSYYDLFQREAATFTTPLWTVPGNHEAFGIERDKSGVATSNPLYGRTMYRSYRGPDYYSFDAGGVHFVGLNSIDIDDTRYYGHVDSLQLQWLRNDLAAIPSTMPVVTFNHIPFYSAMEAMKGLVETPPAPTIITINGKNQFRHTVSNATEVLAALKGHPYPLALAGHIHVRERLRYEGLPTRFEQTAAIVAPSPAAGVMMTSGFTVYRITRGQIDDGRFVPLGLDKPTP